MANYITTLDNNKKVVYNKFNHKRYYSSCVPHKKKIPPKLPLWGDCFGLFVGLIMPV